MTEIIPTPETNAILRRLEKVVKAVLKEQEEPMDMEEARLFLKIKKIATLQAKASRGEIPCHKMIKGGYYFYRSELNAFIRKTLTNAKQ